MGKRRLARASAGKDGRADDVKEQAWAAGRRRRKSPAWPKHKEKIKQRVIGKARDGESMARGEKDGQRSVE